MEMNAEFDLVVIGAGPAGAAAAITAADRGLRVALLESGHYPRHKVCGEFVSAEAIEVLRNLIPDHVGLLNTAPRIVTSRLHAGGHTVSMPLNEPAYSIPRIQLDERLWQEASSRRVACLNTEAKSVARANGLFEVSTADLPLRSRHLINASGRWSRLSQPDAPTEPWIGLKAHFRGETDDSVDLYFMEHGYCGVQAVSPGVLNACALVKQGSARQLNEIFLKDPSLLRRSNGWEQITETYATAPVHLGLRAPMRAGVLQVGDAAGFVDPFVGDGISLALRSGVLAGRSVAANMAAEFPTLYLRAFSAIFRNTRLIRSALAASNVLRPWLVQTVRLPFVSRQVFHATRAARLDVLSPLLPLN